MDRSGASISEILLAHWDPIGVADEPKARNEYDEYAARILRLLASGVRETDLRTFLVRIATDELGLAADEERAGAAAQRILALPHRPD